VVLWYLFLPYLPTYSIQNQACLLKQNVVGCVFVLDGMDFPVIVFVAAPVFFGTRTKNMIRKSVPSSTKTEQLFCVACVTLRKIRPIRHKNRTFFFVACVTLGTWRSGYGTTSQKCRATHPVVCRLQKWPKNL
jgi:hypothetical protein